MFRVAENSHRHLVWFGGASLGTGMQPVRCVPLPMRCEYVYGQSCNELLHRNTHGDVQAQPEAIAWGCSIAQFRSQVHHHFVVGCVRPILDARSETVRMQALYSCRPSLAFTLSDAMLPTLVSVGLSLAVARVTLEIAAVNAPKDGTRIRGNACHVAAMPAFTPWD
jgi:hypothetical protein